jgi:ATP-binding cassette subfamily F protein 3
VEVFPGNYEDYLWRKQGAGANADEPGVSTAAWVPTLSDVPGYEEQKPDSRKRVNPIKLKQMQERCREVEQGIAEVERGVTECERELQSYVSGSETARWTELLAQRRSELESLMAEWEELSQVLEEAKVSGSPTVSH